VLVSMAGSLGVVLESAYRNLVVIPWVS